MNYDIEVMRRYDTKNLVNIKTFYEEVIASKENFDIYIGTDSQFIAGKINYTTVIAFRFGNQGVRGLYRTLTEIQNSFHLYEKKGKKKHRPVDRKKTFNSEIYNRLRKETHLSIETANFVKDFLKVKQIDLDYSTKAINISNNIVAECHALCAYNGFKVSLKGEEQVATPFADKICK